MRGRLEEDIRSWSRQVVEVPNPYMPNGMCACPFAERAWLEDKVEVREADDPLTEAARVSHRFPEDKDLVIVASLNVPDLEAFEERVAELNDEFLYLDRFLMGFHPEYGAEDQELDFLYEHDWESDVEEEYCMIFVQSLQQVVAYSDRLHALGYYDAFPPEEYQQLVVERKRRLTNGNETPCDEEEGQEGHGPRRHGVQEEGHGSRRHGEQKAEGS